MFFLVYIFQIISLFLFYHHFQLIHLDIKCTLKSFFTLFFLLFMIIQHIITQMVKNILNSFRPKSYLITIQQNYHYVYIVYH